MILFSKTERSNFNLIFIQNYNFFLYLYVTNIYLFSVISGAKFTFNFFKLKFFKKTWLKTKLFYLKNSNIYFQKNNYLIKKYGNTWLLNNFFFSLSFIKNKLFFFNYLTFQVTFFYLINLNLNKNYLIRVLPSKVKTYRADLRFNNFFNLFFFNNSVL